MSDIFLICGNTASGKSTYSIRLAQEHQAVWFSIDPWMQALYGADYDPQHHSFAWLQERTKRCKTVIRQTAEQVIAQGMNVVLEIGFGDMKSREHYTKWGEEQGAKVYVHYLDVPASIRRERVRNRNADKGETFSFTVTEEMFDYVEPLFVPPGEDEKITLVKIANQVNM